MSMQFTRQQAEEFLFREARLLDEGKFEEWLGLFDQDSIYWIPENKDDIDPSREVSIVYDDRRGLQTRIFRLTHGEMSAQIPPSKTRHFYTNVEVIERQSPDRALVQANFIVYESRRGKTRSFAGYCEFKLRFLDGGIRIALKKANIIDNDQPISNLTILL